MGAWDTFKNKVTSVGNQVASKSKDTAAQLKTESEIRELRNEADRKLLQLGRQVYQDLTGSATASSAPASPADLKEKYRDALAAISSLNDQIAAKEKVVADLKAQITCPNCGRSVPPDTKYCPFCHGPVGPEEVRMAQEEAARQAAQAHAPYGQAPYGQAPQGAYAGGAPQGPYVGQPARAAQGPYAGQPARAAQGQPSQGPYAGGAQGSGFCSKCGAPLESGASFCMKCGAPVKKTSIAADAPITAPAKDPDADALETASEAAAAPAATAPAKDPDADALEAASEATAAPAATAPASSDMNSRPASTEKN